MHNQVIARIRLTNLPALVMQYGILRAAIVEERLQVFAHVMRLNLTCATGSPGSGSGYAAGVSSYLPHSEACEGLNFDDAMLSVIDQDFNWQAEWSNF